MTSYAEVAEYAVEILTVGRFVSGDARPTCWDEFDQLSDKIHDRFEMGPTTCTSAMAHLLFAIGAASNPQRVFAAGSYHGYMLAWIVGGAGSGERRVPAVTAADVDPVANEMASANFAKVPSLGAPRFCEADAVAVAGDLSDLDLVFVDIDEPLTRKSRYTEVVEAVLPACDAGALVLVHDTAVELFDADMARLRHAVAENERTVAMIDLPVDECGLSVVRCA